MPLPNALISGKRPIGGGLAPIGAAAAPSVVATIVATGQSRLPFTMQPQVEDNWCWAATATSVSLFYDPCSSWTQCQVANHTLPLAGVDCCPDGSISACDMPYFLDRALATTSNFLDVRAGVVGFSDLVALIGTSNPLGARVAWSGGGGHFVVLHGWQKTVTGGEFVDVADPIYGSSKIPYSEFFGAYQVTGSWSHSYWTQP